MPDKQEYCEFTGCGSEIIGLRCSKFGHPAESRPAKSEQSKDQMTTEVGPTNPQVQLRDMDKAVIADQG